MRLVDTGGCLVLFRHAGDVPAHRVDHHRHIRALCEAGAGRVLALASVGSLRTDWPVGTAVAPDDFLAPSVAPTFHHDMAGHSIPGFDHEWRRQLLGSWPDEVMPLVDGGTYAQTSGPRFETPAEVRMLAGFADVVGMTLVGECVLAREAGLRYAAVAMVDNMANGLGDDQLTLESYAEAKAANEVGLAAAVATVVERVGGARWER